MYDVLSHSGRSGPRGSVHYCQRVGSPGSLNRESSFDPERKVGTGLLPLWSTDVSYQGIFGRPHILKKWFYPFEIAFAEFIPLWT